MQLLTAIDQEFLEATGLEFDVVSDGGLICVIIKDWRLPEGYSPNRSDLLLRLPPQFPDVQPDMFWFCPAVELVRTRAAPPAADQFQDFLGRVWQRFSRHLPTGVWQPGRDSLRSYVALIRRDLERTAG